MIDLKSEIINGVRHKIVNILKSRRDLTYREIGELFGISRQRVHQIAKTAGLTKERDSCCFRKDITTGKVLELYSHNLLVKEIAQMLSCCEYTVRKRLRAAGISKSECYSRGIKLALNRVAMIEVGSARGN